jgi:hypothetical protein
MKAPFWLAGWVLCVTGFAEADLRVGDSRDQVIALLGEPTARIAMQKREWLTYDRGQVVVVDGLVNQIDLISAEAHAERLAQEARRAQERQQRAEELVVRRTAEGAERREKTLQDVRFASSSGTARLAYWQTFASRYPETDVSLELANAMADARVEETARRAEVEQQRRVEALEQRVAVAENRAAQAERDARDNRDRRVIYYNYPSSYVVNPNCPTPRPPVVFQSDGPVGDVKVENGYRTIWQHPSANNRHGTTIEVNNNGVSGRISL